MARVRGSLLLGTRWGREQPRGADAGGLQRRMGRERRKRSHWGFPALRARKLLCKRRGRDSNSRTTLRPSTVFETVAVHIGSRVIASIAVLDAGEETTKLLNCL